MASKQTKAPEGSSQLQMKSYVVLGRVWKLDTMSSSLKYAQWPQWASYMNIQAVLSTNSRQEVKSF